MKSAQSHLKAKRNTILFIGSIVLSIILYKYGFFEALVTATPNLRVLHTYLAGIFFTSVFTLTFSLSLFAELVETSPIKYLVPIGGLGAMTGDLIIFKAMSNKVIQKERDAVLEKVKRLPLKKIMHTRLFTIGAAIVGALIIASPFPDELGIGLMSLSNLKLKHFLLISLIVNSIGIFLFLTATEFILNEF